MLQSSLFSTFESNGENRMEARNPYLLPPNVDPIHYNIELKPDLAKFTFTGSETIQVAIKEATARVTLHALDLRVKKAEIRPAGGDWLASKRITKSKKMESIII